MTKSIERCIRSLAEGAGVESTVDLTRELKQLGLEFREESGKIYLSQTLELLDSNEIMRRISSKPELEIHWSIDSTNSYLVGKKPGPKAVTICLAEQQLAGRGRRGKSWVSPFGKNIYLSLGREFGRQITDLGGLSLVVGTQVLKTLHACGLAEAGLKWPNDIILKGGKLAGILVELGVPADDSVFAVIGVGVNLSMREADSQKIDQPFSTVEQYASVSRNELAGRLSENLLQAMTIFEQEGFTAFHEEWNRCNLYRGRQVVIHRGEERIDGTDIGVDVNGNLLLETVDGVRVFNAGEVSLRARG
jgi:BirA family biotin operon repressor/biotin-[acetyl-CoA-carboxylase] ligase|tara:strand:+ start:190 stop:1104 length:915 start_codon:yes stop_codon:yes gene_type:complete